MPAEPTLEVELKYRATPAALAELERVDRIGEATIGPVHRVDEVDRYLDTPDGRLAAARWACRLRTRDGRTVISLKGPPSGSAGAIHRRPEIEGPASESLDPSAWPPSAARERLAALAGSLAPLVERLRLRQRRLERSVSLAGRPVGTLSLDEVAVAWRGAQCGTLRDVELELVAEAEPLVGELAGALAAVRGLDPEPRSKLERALAAVEAAGPPHGG